MESDVLFQRFLFHWFRKLAQMAGIDIFLDNYKPTAYTYVVISTFYVFLFSCLWTIYSYEFDVKLICASMLAFDCQGIVKFHSFFKNTIEVREMCDFCLKIYKANTKSSLNKTCLEKSVKLTVFLFKYGMCLLITTAILLLIKPYISYILFAELEPILPVHFPGINEGYVTLAAFHLYIVFLFVIGTGATDLGLMTFVIHCHTISREEYIFGCIIEIIFIKTAE